MVDLVQQQLVSTLAEQGISIQDRQLAQFERYYEELVDWNERMNLTGITEREEVYRKHFYDSLTLAFYVPLAEIKTMADIGAGAGFPSIPLKIVYPNLQLTIVDSLNKRIQFLNHLCNSLELQDVLCVHGRAEDIARDRMHRDQYDLVTARAVARMNVLNEFCLPFVRPGGTFAAMKGADPRDELQEAAKSLRELRAEQVRVIDFELPVDQSQRHIVLVRKLAETPKAYPRKAGTPLKSPIV